jgi:hypothetical protein
MHLPWRLFHAFCSFLISYILCLLFFFSGSHWTTLKKLAAPTSCLFEHSNLKLLYCKEAYVVHRETHIMKWTPSPQNWLNSGLIASTKLLYSWVSHLGRVSSSPRLTWPHHKLPQWLLHKLDISEQNRILSLFEVNGLWGGMWYTSEWVRFA